MFDDFSKFYASSSPIDKTPKCVILANNPKKMIFDLIITACLLFTATVVPFRLAFNETDPIEWTVVYGVIDFIFLIDIIITFFTSYTDEDENGGAEVLDIKKIALNYLKGWFLFDILSILPVEYILLSF